MKVLLDTCIIIDALQSREPFAKTAQGIFLAVADRKIEGYLTAKSITDIYYLTHRQTHSDIATRNILQSLFKLFGLIDTFGTDCENAIYSQMKDYEDAVMSESAAREKMNYIVTRNTKDYSKSRIPVITPDELLKLI